LTVLTACAPAVSTPDSSPALSTGTPQPLETSTSSTVPATAPPVTEAPATETPVPTLLPIPEFDELLFFAAGGVGESSPCMADLASTLNVDPSVIDDLQAQGAAWEYPGALPLVYRADYKTSSYAAKTHNSLCIWAPYFGDTVDIALETPDGVYRVTKSATPESGIGYDYFEFANATIFGISYQWPVGLPGGEWSLTVTSADWQFEETFVPRRGEPVVSLLDPQFDGTLPLDQFAERPYEASRLQMGGANFPSGQPVYFLLYKSLKDLSEIPGAEVPFWADMVLRLVQSRVVYADQQGFAITDISGPFEPDTSYLVIAVTDPDTFEGANFLIYPKDGFRTTPTK